MSGARRKVVHLIRGPDENDPKSFRGYCGAYLGAKAKTTRWPDEATCRSCLMRRSA